MESDPLTTHKTCESSPGNMLSWMHELPELHSITDENILPQGLKLTPNEFLEFILYL